MDVTAKRPALRAEKRPWYAVLWSPLWLCLLAGVLIRVWLSVRTHGTLDGDEALLGIQAEHILRGERPIYFYGLSYFGSFEAYIVAAVSAVFGPSVGVLRAVTTAFCLALIALTWWFAGLLADAARLPAYAKRRFTICAALVAAIPPVYDGIIELRTGGGWPESFVIMLLLLILGLRLTTRWHESATTRELALRWAGIGFVVGFGMWVYPLVTVAILASALWIVGDSLVAAVQRLRASLPLMTAIGPSLKELGLAVVAIPTCALGFAPGIVWGAAHGWSNITYLFSLGGSGGGLAHRVIAIAGVTARYGACVAPHVIGGSTPGESLLLTLIHAPLLLLGVGAIGFSVAAVLASYRWPSRTLVRARRLAALPALFGVCSAAIFCASSASRSILLGCHNDLGGRYASPLVLALPFLFAAAFTLLSIVVTEKAAEQGVSMRRALAAFGPAGTPTQRLQALALLGVFALLAVYVVGQSATYGLTNADEAFQSAYCTIAPARYEPIIAYLEQRRVQYIWGANLLVNPISFETDSRIVVADPSAITHPDTTINRIPAYTDAVARADRPTLLVFVNHGDAHPYLLRQLDAQHITYQAAFFPSQPGVDVMAVTPLSQTVSPLTSPSLDIFYCKVVNSPADITPQP